jgi:thiamine biosynthesis lipoprotein
MSSTHQPVRRVFEAMGGACELVAQAQPGGGPLGPALDAAEAEVRRIEAKYSRYRPDSVVSAINAAAGGVPVSVDHETAQLLDFAEALFRSSSGKFDITSGVLRRAWRFDQCRLPESRQVAELLELVGWHSVERELGTIRLPRRGMEIDFGGFGKEYAADRAGMVLKAQEIQHGYVNLGGDFRVVGPKIDGSPWSIGIRHPRQYDRLLAVIPMHSGGLATSGDYERYMDVGGRRYCHVLRPDTGWPVSHWQSVTVVAPLAVTAGSLCTQAMLLEDEGLGFLRGSGMIFLCVDHTGAAYTHQDS